MAKKCCEDESWKTIAGFGGIYRVSSCGRVWVRDCIRLTSKGRKRHFGAKLLRSNPTSKNAYPWVILCHPITRIRRNVQIHILVAETFIGPKPGPNYEVNHDDGNKKNPHLYNIEWATHVDNCLHAYSTGLRGPGRLVTFNGETKRVSVWVKELGLKIQTTYSRLNKGYPAEVAFDVSGKQALLLRRKRLSLAHFAKAPKYKDGLTSLQWASKLGITRLAFLWRLRHYAGNDQFIYHVGPFPRQGPSYTSTK